MANAEHLAKLKEGVEPWNQWRKENPEVQTDPQTTTTGAEAHIDSALFAALKRRSSTIQLLTGFAVARASLRLAGPFGLALQKLNA
jgi:hypothetical protein